MKSILIAALLICAQLANAQIYPNINIKCVDEYNQLDDSEASKLGALIDSYVVKKIYDTNFENENASIEVRYSCTNTPMMKVFCSVSIITEGGGLAALAVTYDRNVDEVKITDDSTDL